jgi:hypothetical protein
MGPGFGRGLFFGASGWAIWVFLALSKTAAGASVCAVKTCFNARPNCPVRGNFPLQSCLSIDEVEHASAQDHPFIDRPQEKT